MEFAPRQNWGSSYFIMVKSFLIWTFTLTVCLLVVGFPLVVIMMTMGALATVVLQSVLPVSAVLVVAGAIIGANMLAIFVSAFVLTFKGIHPQEVTWLRWLHGDATHEHSSIYAACPLTCDLSTFNAN